MRVLEDMESVKRLQAGHGEWTDSMAPVRSFELLTLQLYNCGQQPSCDWGTLPRFISLWLCLSKLSDLTELHELHLIKFHSTSWSNPEFLWT